MKKLFFLAAFLVCASFYSCKKCKTCTAVSTTTLPGIEDQSLTTTFEACGSDAKDAEGTTKTTADVGFGDVSTTTTVTTCE